ncbi:hypothetical protein KJS94_00460 [Flavihumibacter rivuli]|uniref:hypothetical protein n=1 Tax=Flavihumibacter rivuli TaxID=2838156 RepID=UPI001BDEEE4B|nr:hypothetical protein [Flavihumibacter rivuli]ULQ56667.1 hypothetical protein KJS94_00460 [Flavihumibacter rivuli]
MFTSKQQLTVGMGVDPEIAAFFVDRKVPQDNSYWKGRLLYVARGTGYLFIPLYYDLKLKLGLDKSILLGEAYVGLMEKILHEAARQELGELGFQEHIRNIEAFVRPQVVNHDLFGRLHDYFQQQSREPLGNIGTDKPALNRGDALLYQLCVLPEGSPYEEVIRQWCHLVPSFLLMDDLMDMKEDQENNEENALSQYGFDANGVKAAIRDLEGNFQAIGELNPALSEFFKRELERKMASPYFQTLLNP